MRISPPDAPKKANGLGYGKLLAQIVEDGWVVEMEIPWQMLDYPDTTEPFGWVSMLTGYSNALVKNHGGVIWG